MRRLLWSAAPVLVWLTWVTTPALAQPTLVSASSGSAQYLYTFSGNTQVQFGATGVLTPGSYTYAGLPLPGGKVSTTAPSLTLTSSGTWIFSFTFGTIPPLPETWTLTPENPQLPVPGTQVVYSNVVDQPHFGLNIIPGSATLLVTPVSSPPPAVPAPGTLLLLACGLGSLGLLAPRLRRV